MAADLRRVSISKSGLLLSGCIAWAGPTSRWYDESKRPAEDMVKANKGTTFHKHIAEFGLTGEDHSPNDLDNEIVTWLNASIDWLVTHLIPRCSQISYEVAIAVNWVTGEVRILKDVVDREYPKLGRDWQFGTADIVAVLTDGRLLVADWKTGGTDGAEEQLLSLACAFQKAAPIIGSIDGQMQWEKPRPVSISCIQVNENGVWPHEREVTQRELDNHWDAMRFAWEDIGKSYKPVPGVHCTALYCPHLAYCSVHSDNIAKLADGPESNGAQLVPKEALLRKLTDKPRNDQEAGEQMALLSAAKRQINYLIESAKEYSAAGGRIVSGQWEWLDSGNGFRWRKRK